MGATNRNTRIAVAISTFAFLLILCAFFSSSWLVNNGETGKPRFTNLGLWEVCFQNFTDIHRFYDTVFKGCMWVFEEEYYIIHDFLLLGFYITVQLFFTLCFVMCLMSLLLTLMFLRCSRDDDRYVFLLLTIGAIQIFGSVFGFIAVLVFGANGDRRDWMPGWESNDMGWAFALACIGVVLLMPGSILYMVEARRERYKRLNEIGNREANEYVSDDYTPYHAAAQSSRPRRPQAGVAVVGEGIQTDI